MCYGRRGCRVRRKEKQLREAIEYFFRPQESHAHVRELLTERQEIRRAGHRRIVESASEDRPHALAEVMLISFFGEWHKILDHVR